MAEEKQELTVRDICKMYDVTRATVYNWRKKGLPFYKLDGNGLSDPTRHGLEEIVSFVREKIGREPINKIYLSNPV